MPETRSPRKLLFGLLAVPVVLFAAGAVFLVRDWPFTESRVTRALEQSLPISVTFLKFRPTYFPHPGFAGEGVVIRRLARPATIPAVVTIAQFRLEAGYLDLFLRPGYLAKLVLQGVRVQIPPIGTPHENSGWAPDQSASRLRIGTVIGDGAWLEIARADGKPPLDFEIHKVKLTSVGRAEGLAYEVSFHNPLPPGDIEAHGHFGPWHSAEPGQTPLDGHYVFENGDLGVFGGIHGLFRAADKFEGVLEHIRTHAKVDVPEFRVEGAERSVHLSSEFTALVNGTNGDVALEKVHSQFLNTQLETTGKIEGHAGQDGKTALLDFTVNNGRIEDVMSLFVHGRKAPLSGTTDFHAHVVLPPGPGKFLDKVRLTGDFGIAGGQFAKSATQEKVTELSERARGLKTDHTGDSDPGNTVSKLTGHVELRDATATFEDITFEIPGASSRMDGTYNIESKKIDLHGTLKTEAELSEVTGTGVTSVLLKPFNGLFRRKHAGAVVPVHLTGTYSHPEVGVDLPGKEKGKAPPLSKGPAPQAANRAPARADP